MANGMRWENEQIRELPLHLQEQMAISYVNMKGGITTVPLIPGHRNEYNIAEMAFHNGEANRSEQILAILMDRKSRAMGEVHAELVELIRIIQTL